LFCSQKCPGDLILKGYDTAKEVRELNIGVISGFQSSMEKDILQILLRGTQPIVICPARGLEGMRIPVVVRKSLSEGRLLFLSPFVSSLKRPVTKTTEERNFLVGSLADRILIIHAEPNGRLEKICQTFFKWEKPIYVLKSENNQSLSDSGAIPIENALLLT
jgi:hypothetical protein